jgi:hypothetical protein
LPIALVIALALTLPFCNGVLRENVSWILSCVVELVEEDSDGLQSFRCAHKDPFPHDFDFAVELPRLTTFRHFLQVGFEASILFFIKLSQMLDGELLMRFLFSAVAIYLSSFRGAFVLLRQTRQRNQTKSDTILCEQFYLATFKGFPLAPFRLYCGFRLSV